MATSTLFIALVLIVSGPIELFRGSVAGASEGHLAQSVSNQARVVPGATVTLEYQVTVQGEAPIAYTDVTQFVQGSHNIFPTLEHKIAGMKPGEHKRVTLAPRQAFGERDERKKVIVPKNELPADAKPGDILRNDAGTIATVEAESATEAVLDYNHPLAGKQLVVSVTILDVKGR